MPMVPDPPPSRPITLICHLLAVPAAAGQIVGHVEVVSTGDIVSIADIDDLLAVLRRAALDLDAVAPPS